MQKKEKSIKFTVSFTEKKFQSAVFPADSVRHSRAITGNAGARPPVEGMVVRASGSRVAGRVVYGNKSRSATAGDWKKVGTGENQVVRDPVLRSLRPTAAILAGKAALWLVRFLGGGRGSSLPGMVALKICPGILGRLAKHTYRSVVMVTGTNGKTTTNNMIARVLGKAGYRVLVNAEGANLVTGLTTAFIKNASLLGKVERDYVLLEVDEASFPQVTRQVSPDIVVVTNFSRDQLDRHGELDKTISLVREALLKLPDTRLVLNADDPLAAELAISTGLKANFYGLGESPQQKFLYSAVQERRLCPVCDRELDQACYRHGHLGDYRCPGCGFSRPFTEVEGLNASATGGSATCRLNLSGVSRRLVIPAPGLYNLYNGLAAFTVCMLLGLEPDLVIRALGGHTPIPGRAERFRYQDKPALLNLVKNPVSFNEGLNILPALPGPVDILIAINDNSADGRDVSWLWDVDFEALNKHRRHINLLVCTGLRRVETAVRLKYAGLPVDKITVREMPEAVKDILCGDGAAAYLLTNYTALWPLERIMNKYAQRENVVKGMSPVS